MRVSKSSKSVTESLKVVLGMPRVDKLSPHSIRRLEIRISLCNVEEFKMIFFSIDILDVF